MEHYYFITGAVRQLRERRKLRRIAVGLGHERNQAFANKPA